MDLDQVKERCKFRLENWDEYEKFYACNKNGNGYKRQAEECLVCKDCEQHIKEPVIVTEEKIKNGNNDEFIKLIKEIQERLNELLILEEKGEKFVPRHEAFNRLYGCVQLLSVKYVNKNTDLWLHDIDMKLTEMKT